MKDFKETGLYTVLILLGVSCGLFLLLHIPPELSKIICILPICVIVLSVGIAILCLVNYIFEKAKKDKAPLDVFISGSGD